MTDFGSFGLDTDEVTTRSVETDFARRFGQYFARRIVSRFIHDMQTVVSALTLNYLLAYFTLLSRSSSSSHIGS